MDFFTYYCAAPLLVEKSATRVPGEYVVIFEEIISDEDGKLYNFIIFLQKAIFFCLHRCPSCIDS